MKKMKKHVVKHGNRNTKNNENKGTKKIVRVRVIFAITPISFYATI